MYGINHNYYYNSVLLKLFNPKSIYMISRFYAGKEYFSFITRKYNEVIFTKNIIYLFF